MNLKLTHALELIQRAQKSIDANRDVVYCDLLGSSLHSFKQQLSDDHGLSIEFFEPVIAGQIVEKKSEKSLISKNPELTLKAKRFYEIIDTSIWW